MDKYPVLIVSGGTRRWSETSRTREEVEAAAMAMFSGPDEYLEYSHRTHQKFSKGIQKKVSLQNQQNQEFSWWTTYRFSDIF